MTLSCVVCGASFEAQKPQAKTCGATCRKRRARGAGSRDVPISRPVIRTDVTVSRPAPDVVRPNFANHEGAVAAVTAELEAVGGTATTLGQIALCLAVRLETSQIDTGSGLASLSKELRSVMAEVIGGSNSAVIDPIDELRARRDRKRTG